MRGNLPGDRPQSGLLWSLCTLTAMGVQAHQPAAETPAEVLPSSCMERVSVVTFLKEKEPPPLVTVLYESPQTLVACQAWGDAVQEGQGPGKGAGGLCPWCEASDPPGRPGAGSSWWRPRHPGLGPGQE